MNHLLNYTLISSGILESQLFYSFVSLLNAEGTKVIITKYMNKKIPISELHT